MLRKTVSITFGVAAVLLVGAGTLTGCSHDFAVRTVENSRQIEQSFERAVGFVEEFKSREGRLPTQDEFSRWTTSTSHRAYSPYGMEISTEAYPAEAVAELGEPPEGAYVLSFWRGEWMEHYAGWSGQSTLVFDTRAFYIFGSPLLDGLAYAFAGLLLMFLAWSVWPRSPQLAT